MGYIIAGFHHSGFHSCTDTVLQVRCSDTSSLAIYTDRMKSLQLYSISTYIVMP
jgi:hypothetical protein